MGQKVRAGAPVTPQTFYYLPALAGILITTSVIYFTFLVGNVIYFSETFIYYTNWALLCQALVCMCLGILHIYKYPIHQNFGWVRNLFILMLLPFQLATGTCIAIGITVLIPYTSMIDEGIAQYGKELVYSWNTAFHYATIFVIFLACVFDFGYIKSTFRAYTHNPFMQFWTMLSASAFIFLCWLSTNDPNVVYETTVKRYIMVIGILSCQVVALLCFTVIVYTQ